jgi:peptide deformylase
MYPNSSLFTPLGFIPVEDIRSDTFTQIASSMFGILKRKGGIGLSANQVGLPLRMCVINITEPLILINPTIVKQSKVMEKSREGCLSVPGATVTVSRHDNITVQYRTVTGEPQELEAKGLLSYCIQHEVDHLNGVLMLNRVGEYAKSRALKQFYKFKKYKGQKP